MDYENNQNKMQFEGEKSTLRKTTPDHSDKRNSLKKAFPERPSEALLKGEKRTLREAIPGQPRDEDSCEGWSHYQEMESLSQQCLNKIDECPDKVAPPTVNEDKEQINICCLSQIHQPIEWLLESQNQQAYGWKCKTEGEDKNLDNYLAQHLWARLAIAMELLMKDYEFKVNEEVQAACEKAGIHLPKSYSEAVNDPIYGSK